MTDSTTVASTATTDSFPEPASVAAAERARLAAEAATRTSEPLSPQELEDEITAARHRLAGTIDDIADRVNPKNVAERTTAKAKVRATTAAEQARTTMTVFFHTPSGELDTRKVSAVGGAVLLVVAIKIIARVRTRRG